MLYTDWWCPQMIDSSQQIVTDLHACELSSDTRKLCLFGTASIAGLEARLQVPIPNLMITPLARPKPLQLSSLDMITKQCWHCRLTTSTRPK